MNVRKFRKTDERNVKMRPYERRSKRAPRHGSNGLLPTTMYVPVYVTPSSPEFTGR